MFRPHNLVTALRAGDRFLTTLAGEVYESKNTSAQFFSRSEYSFFAGTKVAAEIQYLKILQRRLLKDDYFTAG